MTKYAAILLLLLVSVNAAVSDEDISVKTVPDVDLERYMGNWYEIARIPNSFQKKCIGNVTANYTLRPDKTVRVINRCLEEDGKTDMAEGVAKIVDTETNAKLKVSFFSIFGINLFWGNYWIIYLDESYKNAVVGDPKRKYGWILSREKELTQKELKPMYEALVKNGYKTEDFVPTKQNIKD